MKNTPKFKKRICGSLDSLPLQNSDIFSVKFSVFKNFTSAAVFYIKFQNFRHLLNFHLLFPFLTLTEC